MMFETGEHQIEVVCAGIQAALECTHHRCRDAGGVPVHPHHGAERLKPKRIAQAGQEGRASVMMNDALGDCSAKRRHARRQPRWHPSAVQREIGNAGALHRTIVSPEPRSRAQDKMRALEWAQLDFVERQIRIKQSEWRGEVTSIKAIECGMC